MHGGPRPGKVDALALRLHANRDPNLKRVPASVASYLESECTEVLRRVLGVERLAHADHAQRRARYPLGGGEIETVLRDG